jgi:hypothetical protein
MYMWVSATRDMEVAIRISNNGGLGPGCMALCMYGIWKAEDAPALALAWVLRSGGAGGGGDTGQGRREGGRGGGRLWG